MSDLLVQYPEFAEARLVRGQGYLNEGKSDAALQELLAVVKANPKEIEAELSHRPDGDWNGPGERIDLSFLQRYKNHHTTQS